MAVPMPFWPPTPSCRTRRLHPALVLVAAIGCRLRDDSPQQADTATSQVPVVQLQEIAAHPLELLEPVPSIPDLRAAPGRALAVLVATHFDDASSSSARQAWEVALGAAEVGGSPLELLAPGFLELEKSLLSGAGAALPSGLVFEAAVMDSEADFGAVAGVRQERGPQRLAESILRSDATLALFASEPAPDAGAERDSLPAPRVVAAMIVRSVTGELGAAVETGAPPTFPMTVGAAALPGAALYVEGGTAAIVLGADPWFASAGFARKLHERHVTSGDDLSASLDWARERLREHKPMALGLVTRQRHAVWTSAEAFWAVHTWAPASASAGDSTPARAASGESPRSEDNPSSADGGAGASDAGPRPHGRDTP